MLAHRAGGATATARCKPNYEIASMTPASILSISQTFQRGHALCFGNGLPADNGKSNALIPAVVCLAFATELALKAILLAEGNLSHGHKLDELFAKLQQRTQLLVMKKIGLEGGAFKANLAAVSNAFVDWRYIYEAPGSHSLNLPFMRSLCDVLSAVANQATRFKPRSPQGAD